MFGSDGMAMMCVLYPDFVKDSIQTHASCITQEGETYAQVIFYQEGFTYEMVPNAFDSYHVTLVTEVAKDSYFTRYLDAIK